MNRALADMLAQQRQATQEIAQNVQGIAEKATKTRGEIASIIERLVKAEATAQKALDAAEKTAPAYSLVRLAGDVGAWKRRLANVLLGQATPDRRAASLRKETSTALATQLAGSAFQQHPAFACFARAEQDASTEAERMVAALSRRDWDTGTPAFTAASEAMARMRAAADQLIASKRD